MYYPDMFYLYVNSISAGGLDGEASSVRFHRDPLITQTSWGGLCVRFKRLPGDAVHTRCAIKQTFEQLLIIME